MKANSLGGNFLPSDDQNGFNVFGFIDNTTIETCRPGGGPAAPGVDAPRYEYLIQRAKHHGLKFQSVVLPNGMDYHVYGPVSLRHNDLYTLGHSEILSSIKDIQLGENLQYVIYGDSAYLLIRDTHLRCRHSGDRLTPIQQTENAAMSSCRESIEWNFGSTKTLWAYLQFSRYLIRHMTMHSTSSELMSNHFQSSIAAHVRRREQNLSKLLQECGF